MGHKPQNRTRDVFTEIKSGILNNFNLLALGALVFPNPLTCNAERSKEQELRRSGELIYKGRSAVSEHVL